MVIYHIMLDIAGLTHMKPYTNFKQVIVDDGKKFNILYHGYTLVHTP
jgi:hypothetical protein